MNETERICKLLNLNVGVGLGRRLAQAEVKQDTEDQNLFYIYGQDNVIEGAALAAALATQAEKLNLRVRFEPVRTIASW